jgi:tellurite resistance protein
MGTMEDTELLRAAMAVAAADGELRRSEMGVVEGLATRVGIGKASFDAMLEAAEHDDSIADNILIHSKERARSALELLVALARIDGEISEQERGVLVRIAAGLRITEDEFQNVYKEGIKRADEIRKSRRS